MALKAARRVSDWTDWQGNFYSQRGYNAPSTKVCTYWLAGRCNRNPCRFLHMDLPQYNGVQNQPKQAHSLPNVQPVNGFTYSSKIISGSARVERERKDAVFLKSQDSVCQYWASGNCVKGDGCRFLHSWFQGSDFTLLTKLEGHKKVIHLVFLYLYFLRTAVD